MMITDSPRRRGSPRAARCRRARASSRSAMTSRSPPRRTICTASSGLFVGLHRACGDRFLADDHREQLEHPGLVSRRPVSVPEDPSVQVNGCGVRSLRTLGLDRSPSRRWPSLALWAHGSRSARDRNGWRRSDAGTSSLCSLRSADGDLPPRHRSLHGAPPGVVTIERRPGVFRLLRRGRFPPRWCPRWRATMP